MFLTRKFLRLNKVNIAIVIFMILFTLIHLYRPILMYTKEGGFRQFGVGYKHKTVIPIWIVAIIIAIFSYLAVLFI
jgi:hypothetical protein